MRYASIRSMDISNGEGIGVSLFVQGCSFRCKNCFNSETWDFNGGNEWDKIIKEKFLSLINRPYINRVTILGGEPLAKENLEDISSLIINIRTKYPNKKIWLYTGYKWSEIFNLDFSKNEFAKNIIKNCDVVVDGQYVDELKDISLKWRGSSNQRVIDVKKTVKNKEIVIYQK